MFLQSTFDFALRIPFGNSFSLVIQLLTTNKCKLDFGDFSLEVDTEWNETQASLDRPSVEFLDLAGVHQQLPFPPGIMIMNIPLFVGSDMEAVQPDFTRFDSGITIGELCFTLPQRFYLGTHQHNPGFIGLKNLIFVPGFAVLGHNLLARFLHGAMILQQIGIRKVFRGYGTLCCALKGQEWLDQPIQPPYPPAIQREPLPENWIESGFNPGQDLTYDSTRDLTQMRELRLKSEMIKIRFMLSLLLLLAASVSATAATLSGYVYDRYSDQPIVGAAVTIEETSFTTTTNADGYFVFSNIPGGIYDVKVTFDGYYEGYRRRLRLGTQQSQEIEIRIKPITADERADQAQAARAFGALAGTITSQTSGAALPGAVVKIDELGLGTQTGIDGKFQFLRLKPGRYTIETILIGYKQVKNYSVDVFGADTTDLNIALEETVLPLGSEVVVYGEKPLLDPTVPATVRSIERQEIDRGAARGISDILQELPGVVEIDNELHIRGGRTYETQYMVDGVSVTDPLIRQGYGHSLNSGSVKEINLYSGGADAEFAQATSGVVEIITKEGQEDFTGSINYRNDHPFGDASFNTDQLEASLSGPEPLTTRLVNGVGLPGETYFFASGNFLLTDTHLPFSTNLYSETFGGSSLAPRSDNQYSGLFKLTYKISPLVKLSLSHSAAATINQDRSILETRIRTIDFSYGYPFEYQKILDDYNTFTQKSNQQVISLDWRFDIHKQLRVTAARFFTTLRSQVEGKNWKEYVQPIDALPDTVLYDEQNDIYTVVKGDGFWDGGDGDTWYDHYIENYSLKSTYETEIEPNFTFKTGFQSEFQTIQVFDLFQPWLSESGYGLNYDIYKAQPSTHGLFIQNNINLNGLIFDFGVRYDLWLVGKYAEDAFEAESLSVLSEALKTKFEDETIDLFGRRARGTFSPRFGVSNPISRDLTLFASYSRFARRPSPQYLYAKLYTPSQATYQLFGNPALDYEKVTNIEAGLKWLPGKRVAVGVSGYIKYISDYIAATSVAPDPRFPDETYFLYFNLDYATSQGVEIEYVQDFSDIVSISANTAFSKATGERSLPADILRGLETRSEGAIYNDIAFDWDKPWQFILKTNIHVEDNQDVSFLGMALPDDWNLNIKFWGQAGKRYTPYQEAVDEDGFQVFVPSGETNSKIGPWWNSLDFAFQKNFRLDSYTVTLFFEGLNLLDHKNVTLINPLTGDVYKEGDTIPTGGNLFELPPLGYELPLWENPTRYLAPRQLKLGLGVSF